MSGDAAGRTVAAVEAVYAAAADPGAWPAALQAIADVTEDVGSLLVLQRDDGSLGTIVSPGLEQAQDEYSRGGWWQQDIRVRRGVERGYISSRDTVTERHLVTEEEIATLPFYAVFLAGQGLKWFAGTMISPDPHVTVILSVQRGASRSPYSDDELAIVSRMGRHVENALRLNVRLTGLEAANVALAEALARLDAGVFLVDGMGRATAANPAAEARAGGALALVRGRLAAGDPRSQAALDAAIAAAIAPAGDGEAAPPLLLRDGDDGGDLLMVQALPVRPPSGHVFSRLLVQARALVLVRRAGPGEPPDPAALRDLLDLTLGEARIAALVGSGLAPREAAARLGIAEETARTVLKRVFAKTGARRQGELANLIARLALR